MSDIYQKAGGSAGTKGVDFQINLISIFLLNALENLEDWKLSTENKLAGKFDDIVLELSDGRAILLQAKYKENKKISLDQLLSSNSRNDDFSLPKYFFSYLDIKTKFPVKSIIICTNTFAGSKVSRFLNQNQVCSDNILYYKYGTSFFTVSEDIVMDLMENAKDYYKKNLQGKTIDETVITEENMKEFLHVLELYLSYPSGSYLTKIIDKMLTGSNSFGNLFSNTKHRDLYIKIKEWFEQSKGEFLTENRAKAMFCEIKSEKYCESLENYKIFFEANDLNIPDSNKRIIHVVAQEEKLLYLMKIYRILQKIEAKILFVDCDCSRDMQVQMIEAFAFPLYTYLIIVSPKFADESLMNKISTRLVDILHTRRFKKIIFVAEKSNKLVQRMSSISDYYVTSDYLLTLDDLSEDSYIELLKKKCVIFQGEDFSLEELLPQPITAGQKRSLTSDVLEKIIRGEKISVGQKLRGLKEEISKYYLDRTFERKISGYNNASSKKEHVVSEKDCFDTKEKLVLISDSAGTGKTTVLTNLAISIKKANPRLWIIRIELNDCTKKLGDFLKEPKPVSLSELIILKENCNPVSQLEKIVFSLEGRVVLMFDGVDEISPDYTNLIIDLLCQSEKAANVAKVFATTRPCIVPQLQAHLTIVPFTLVPLTITNQTDFLTNYWIHHLQLESENHLKCRHYAENLLSKISFLISNWYNEDENQLGVIPLHARMLAEIFLENKGSVHWEGCKEYLHSNELVPKLPERINISMLYKMFIEKKRVIFINKGNPTGNTSANKALTDQFEKYLNHHRSAALDILLDNKQRAIFKGYQIDINNKEIKIERIGIVQWINNRICFIHRTFAEFFLAEIIFRELELRNDDVDFQRFLIDRVFFYWKHNILRYFLNSFLHDLRLPLPSNIFSSYKSIIDFRFPQQPSLTSNFLSNILYDNSEVTEYNDKDTIIHRLAYEGNTEIIRLLLKSIGFQNTRKYRFTASFRLSLKKENTLNNLKNLVRHNGINIKNFDAETPLHHAVIGNHLDTVKYLMEIGADVNVKNDSGNTPLLVAVQKGKWNIADLFLKSGTDFNVADYQGNQVLHSAAKASKTDIITFLLDRGMDINSTNDHGRTALHFAVQRSNRETVSLLLAGGADFNMVDLKGRTPLHLTALIGRQGRQDIVELLMEYGIDANIIDEEGYTALHFAVECDNFRIVECLVKHGVNINVADKEGRTAFHLAVLRGRQHIVEFLVGQGVDLNMTDKKGRTVLHAAAETTRSTTFKFLVEQGAKINIKDNEGLTVLHVAVESRSCDIIQFLLKHGIDSSVQDNRGRTALDLATLMKLDDIVEILNSSGSIRKEQPSY